MKEPVWTIIAKLAYGLQSTIKRDPPNVSMLMTFVDNRRVCSSSLIKNCEKMVTTQTVNQFIL